MRSSKSGALAFALVLLGGCGVESRAGDGALDRDWVALVRSFPGATDGAELWLSATGLYDDMGERVAADLHELEPAYALWSDGAEKRRWLRLPRGARIDSTNMDRWQLPVGAMLFKEFVRDGRRIETRLIARTGAGASDFWMGAFVWNDGESDARFVPEGKLDARGTEHDVPSAKTCGTCHNGEPGRVLGLSAVQQPDISPELLSQPMPRPFLPPGDGVTRAALGYLHANCAHCHNPRGSARPDTDMDLRLAFTDLTPEETSAYRTTVARPLQYFKTSPHRTRVAPRAPEQSGLLYRMSERGTESQMPPLASERRDEVGMQLVRAWIESL